MQLEHGTAEQDPLGVVAAQHEPGASRDRGAPPAHEPAAAHPQVRADDHPALEAEDQVLAERLDRVEPAAVDPLRDLRRLRARMERLHLEHLARQHLQAPGGPVQGVALGHQAARAAARSSARPTAGVDPSTSGAAEHARIDDRVRQPRDGQVRPDAGCPTHL